MAAGGRVRGRVRGRVPEGAGGCGCFLRKMKASLWHVRAYGKATYKFLSAPLHLCNFPKRVGSTLVKIPLIQDGRGPKKGSRIDEFLAICGRTRCRASLRRPTRQVVARFISRTPPAAPKTAPTRPKTPTRRPEDVFFCARVPENTIKPVVFYTFLKCVKTRSRRTGDAPRRLQDPSRSLPKKSCSHLGGVLGASWGVLGRLGASWTRLGGVLGSILDLKILSFFRLFCGVHFGVIL